MTTPAEQRAKELKAIHAAVRELGLSDDEYRSYLDAWTGQASSAKLTQEERHKVIENFRRMGFARKEQHPSQLIILEDDERQIKKIKLLWLDLHRRGKIEAPTLSSLNAFVRRMVGIDHVHWLRNQPPEKASIVIEGLKAWRDRPAKDEAKEGKPSTQSA